MSQRVIFTNQYIQHFVWSFEDILPWRIQNKDIAPLRNMRFVVYVHSMFGYRDIREAGHGELAITESFISTMYTTAAWAKKNQNASFEKINIKRNNGSETDVTFKLKYCGICHSDVHIAENHMGNFTPYLFYSYYY